MKRQKFSKISLFLPAIFSLSLVSGCKNDQNLTAIAPDLPPSALEGDPSYVIDDYVQKYSGQIDVLLVIDNSVSMNTFADAFEANHKLFWDLGYDLSDSGLDYHIGVITTDMMSADENDEYIYRGKLVEAINGRRYLSSETSHSPSVIGSYLEIMTDVGADSVYPEFGLGATYFALEDSISYTLEAPNEIGYNSGFLRDTAELRILIISDEDNYDEPEYISTEAFIDWLNGLKDSSFTDWTPEERKPVSVSAIVYNYEDVIDDYLYEGSVGYDYLQVVHETGGTVQSILDTDWRSTIRTFWSDELYPIEQTLTLSQLPNPDTLAVWGLDSEGEKEISSSDWTYDASSNSIIFNEGKYPYEYTVIQVIYLPAEEESSWEIE